MSGIPEPHGGALVNGHSILLTIILFLSSPIPITVITQSLYLKFPFIFVQFR